MLTASQNTYTAGRTSQEARQTLAQQELQSAIRGGDAAGANEVAVGASALTSQSGARTSSTLRAQLAGDETRDAIRSALDNPNDAFKATSKGASLATNVNWPTSYNNWA